MKKLLTGVAVAAVMLGSVQTAQAANVPIWIGIGSAAILAAGILGESSDIGDIRVGNGATDLPLSLTLGAGYYNILNDKGEPGHEDRDKGGAGIGRVELRFNQEFLRIRPFIGIEANTESATYFYGGGMLDVRFGEHFILSPNAAVGAYFNGDGRDMGSTVEFRTGIEAAWEFDNRMRIGAAFHHISNAGIGDVNPGVETLTLNLSIPLN
ncbi:acyloxyacyl hydrolase [Inquilinus sp. OTU3971]|uniref:acyloxyacyl hydrolase n=1 Tax=Inquilinus sp. OTU3971 TaxID=3043855 RepID=UPI00313F051D